MGEIVFVLGGTRSGKSSFAQKLTQNENNKTAYIATCPLSDDIEMQERIDLHQKNRPSKWETFVETQNLTSLIEKIDKTFDTIIIDCLTLYVSNLLMQEETFECIENNAQNFLSALKKASFKTIIVSNEVGLGIVPESSLGRKFRDIAGKVNQITAEKADNVYFVISGIPTKIK